jgi:SAM-dependent methyltransferase
MDLLTVPSDVATEWTRSWDAQQEGRIPDRELRFTVLCDILEIGLAEVEQPVIVDLGCGPGSLAGRLQERLPRAKIIGIDTDPLLLSLARSHYGDGIGWVDADLSGDAWRRHVPDTIHGAVSTTALHWLAKPALGDLYRGLGERMATGGILANGDHLGVGDVRLHGIARELRVRRAIRAGTSDRVGWSRWWDDVLSEPAFADIAAARAARPEAAATGDGHDHGHGDGYRIGHDHGGHSQGHGGGAHQHIHHGDRISVQEHAELLTAAGFTAVAPLWQYGDDHVLVAVK